MCLCGGNITSEKEHLFDIYCYSCSIIKIIKFIIRVNYDEKIVVVDKNNRFAASPLKVREKRKDSSRQC